MQIVQLFLRLACCALLLVFMTASASAQFKAGIQGTVKDTSGALVPQAKITLTNTETSKTQETTASDEGFYRISGLPPGKYKLTVEKTGYKQKVFDDVVVNAEAVQGMDVELEPGEVSATVTVTAETTSPLETENANVDKAITTQDVRTLPQTGRDPYELIRTTPGVFGDAARAGTGGAVNLPNFTGPGGTAADRLIFQVENQPQVSANGQRVDANSFQIDGTSVNSLSHGGAAVVTPNQESVKEVRVIANNYSAEFGRNSGAQVLTVSQNGTNNFHGSLFLKNNSPGLNAFNKYGGLNGAPPVRNNQHYNQFGGSLGGPLPIPRFGEDNGPGFKLGRNKVFFFFSYEGLRNNSAGTFNGFVETPEFRQLVQQLHPGSVTAQILGAPGVAPRITSVIPVTCAFAGFPTGLFPNCKQLPGGLDIGSPIGATSQYLPFSDLFGGGLDNIPDIQFAQISTPEISRGNQFNPRVDINLTSKDTLTFSSYLSRFHAIQSDTALGAGARPMADVETKPKNSFAMITYNRIFSPTTTNELRVNATRFAFNEVQSSTTTNFGLPRIQIEDLPLPARIEWGPPWSETTPGIFAENTYEVDDVLRRTMGNHALSIGGGYRKEQNNDNLNGGARPLYTFAGLFNFANGAPLFYQINADPQTGGPPVAQRYFRTHNLNFFGQDDWKFRPNLTLNLGLRWEYFSPLTEKEGHLSNLILGPNGLADARISVVKNFYPPDRNNFAPRLGFAWSPTKIASFATQDKLVLRGGFGVAYDRIPNVLFANSRGNPPFFERVRDCCGTSAQDFSTPFAGGAILYALGSNNTPFSYPVNPALKATFDPVTGIPTLSNGAQIEFWGAPPNVPTPYVYTYSLEGQYSLPAKLTATAGYQGSTSHKLVRIDNEVFEFPTNPGGFNGVFFIRPDTNASYNAMLLTLSRRFAKGFSFDANYRWSKSIDIVSSSEVGAPTNPTVLDVHLERGPSDYDVRHSLIASGIWELPFFRSRHDAAGKLLGGWQLSGIWTWHTGFPWTPVVGNCPSSNRPVICPARPNAYFGGAGTDTSNTAFITGSNFPGGGTKFFSTVAGTLQGATPLPPGVGRNSFRGPHYRDLDVSLAKKFGMPSFFGEGANFEIKANFFNVLNLLNLVPFQFSSSSTTVTDPNFGRATGGLSGRVIEFQGRFNF
jgi:outer membrane lipoprotein-sorting protein